MINILNLNKETPMACLYDFCESKGPKAIILPIRKDRMDVLFSDRGQCTLFKDYESESQEIIDLPPYYFPIGHEVTQIKYVNKSFEQAKEDNDWSSPYFYSTNFRCSLNGEIPIETVALLRAILLEEMPGEPLLSFFLPIDYEVHDINNIKCTYHIHSHFSSTYTSFEVSRSFVDLVIGGVLKESDFLGKKIIDEDKEAAIITGYNSHLKIIEASTKNHKFVIDAAFVEKFSFKKKTGLIFKDSNKELFAVVSSDGEYVKISKGGEDVIEGVPLDIVADGLNWKDAWNMRYVGLSNMTTYGIRAEITKYNNAKSVSVRFEDGCETQEVRMSRFRDGTIRHPLFRGKKAKEYFGFKDVSQEFSLKNGEVFYSATAPNGTKGIWTPQQMINLSKDLDKE